MNKKLKIILISIIGLILVSILTYISYKIYNNYLITNFIREQKEIQINYNKEEIEYIKKDIEDIKKCGFKNKMELIILQNEDIDVADRNIDNLIKKETNEDILNELIKQNEALIVKYNNKYKKDNEILGYNKKIYEDIIEREKYKIKLCNEYLSVKGYLYKKNTLRDIKVFKDSYNNLCESIDGEVLIQERILKLIKIESKKRTQIQNKAQNINNIIVKSNGNIKILLNKYLLSIDTITKKMEEDISVRKQIQTLQIDMLSVMEESKDKVVEVLGYLEKTIYE